MPFDLDDINLGHLAECGCGAGRPDQGWRAVPEVHSCACIACGARVEADTAEAAEAAWNAGVGVQHGQV